MIAPELWLLPAVLGGYPLVGLELVLLLLPDSVGPGGGLGADGWAVVVTGLVYEYPVAVL